MLSNPPPVGKVSAKGDGFVLPYPAKSPGNAGPIRIVVMANQISSSEGQGRRKERRFYKHGQLECLTLSLEFPQGSGTRTDVVLVH